MKEERRKSVKGWDMAAAVMAALLLLLFLLCVCLCLFAVGRLFEPALLFTVGVAELLGLILLMLVRSGRAGKLWRRLLLAGVILNGLIILFICIAFAAMLSALRDPG